MDAWSLKESPTWEKMYKALQIEYNPLENYDRSEEWTEEGTHGNNKTVNNSTEASGNASSRGDAIHNVTGYNSGSEVMQSRDITTGSDNNSSRATGTGTEAETGEHNDTHSGRVHGNIGVTTSQQMLEAEFDLAPEINMYNIITRSFRNRFCLLIY